MLAATVPNSSPLRDCVVMIKNPIDVMLSAAKHLAFSVRYEDEILRLSPQDDIATQSLTGEDKGGGDPSHSSGQTRHPYPYLPLSQGEGKLAASQRSHSCAGECIGETITPL